MSGGRVIGAGAGEAGVGRSSGGCMQRNVYQVRNCITVSMGDTATEKRKMVASRRDDCCVTEDYRPCPLPVIPPAPPVSPCSRARPPPLKPPCSPVRHLPFTPTPQCTRPTPAPGCTVGSPQTPPLAQTWLPPNTRTSHPTLAHPCPPARPRPRRK